MKLNNTFLARCSAIGSIMSEPQKKSPKAIYLDHMDTIKAKELKESETKNKETQTYYKLVLEIEALKEKTDVLKLNSEKIHLSATCIAHVHSWIKSQPEFYGKSNNFRSKYTDKGNRCETDSIKLAADYYGWGKVEKNETRLSNDFLTGECDVLLPESVEDIKNSWSEKTFPLFATEIPIDGYGWQGQGYCELYERPKFGLVYTLMDAPEYMIMREAKARMYDLGLDDLEAELYDEVELSMTYSQYPIELRIKRFALDRDKSCMDAVKYRVDEIRKLIEQL